jgi:glutamyl-tRNA reductase
MYVSVVGVNHKTCPVQTREKLFISTERVREALERFKEQYPESECVVVSTCNRTEIYTSSHDSPIDCEALAEFLAEFQGVSPSEFADSLYHFAMKDCVKHLFCVASSLDSMIVGETQITAQVKDAYRYALRSRFSGRTLNALFQRALAVAKKVRTHTRIGEGKVSVSSVAVQFAEKVFGDLSGRTVLVVGAGEMAELTLKHLMSRGAQNVIVTNRTHEKGVQLAEQFGGEAVPMEQLYDALARADIVVCSTSAAEHLIGKAEVEQCLQSRDNRPILFIDIAVPRNVDPEVGSLDNVYLHNIDHLESIATSNIEERQKEIAKSLEIIESQAKKFMRWLEAQRVSAS